MKKNICLVLLVAVIALFSMRAIGVSQVPRGDIYNPGLLKPTDSTLKVKVGDPLPDFTLPAVSGGQVSLSQFLGKSKVVISFIPAAWTPVCSDQWPGYNIAKGIFDKNDAVLLAISVDNIPTLFAWTNHMGKLWFPVLSDFWPHGAFAQKLGILRSNGVSERAVFIVDKKGIIRYIDVHDINKRPSLGDIARELERLEK